VYRFFRELDDQLDLSQTMIGRGEKQVQARFGVTMAYQLLDRHPYAFEQVVEGLKEGKTAAEAIAIFEAAVTPTDWTDTDGDRIKTAIAAENERKENEPIESEE